MTGTRLVSVAAAVLVSVLLVLPCASQDARAPSPGSRLRVTAPTVAPEPIVGTLAAQDHGQLTLVPRDGGAVAVVAREDILRLERSLRPSRKGKGALLGLGIGFAMGFGAMALLGNCSESPYVVESCGLVWSSFAGGVLGVAGAGIGALVAPGERWADVPLDLVRSTGARNESRGGLDVSVRPLVAGPRRGAVIAVSWP